MSSEVDPEQAPKPHWSGLAALAALIAFVVWLARALIIQPGLPWGVDVYLHLARVWYMATALLRDGTLPLWIPSWYNGTPLEQYYPPLAGYVMLPIQLLTNDIFLTYRIFVVSCLILAALAAYAVFRHWMAPSWSALSAALYIGTPYMYIVVFQDGNASRMLVLILMPVLLGLTAKSLHDGRRTSFILIAPITSLLVLSHHQQAGMALLALGGICLLHVKRDRDSRERVLKTLAAFGLGVVLSAWWLIPGLTHADYSTVPDVTLLPERLSIYSITGNAFNPVGRTASSVSTFYLGAALAGLATLSIIARPTRFKAALYVTSALSVLLAFGVHMPLYAHLPLAKSLFPERFLMFAVLMLVFLVGDLGRVMTTLRPKRWMRAALLCGVAGLMIWDFSPWWGISRMVSYPHVQSSLDSLPARNDLARLSVRSLGMNSEWAFLPLLWSNYPLTYGWSVETTPHSPVFVQNNLALRSGFPQFVQRNYALWNVRAAIITPADASLIEALKTAGFQEYEQPGDVVLYSSQPSTPVMRLESKAIAIGRGAYPTAMAFPWFSIGSSIDVDDYDPAYLEQFDLIYLFDFRYADAGDLEQRIQAWVKQGKTVILDMTSMAESYLFNVQSYYAEVPRRPQFRAGAQADLPVDNVAEQPFEYEGSPWRGVSYAGLSGTLVEAADSAGKPLSVLGYKEMPEGRVYFAGLNLITHIVSTHDQATSDFVDRFFERANPQRGMIQPGFPVTIEQPPADRWSFSYATDQATPVIVSETWSKHWRAQLDGKPLAIYNHENLIALRLPAGAHRVEFRYGSTPIQWIGLGISGLALALLALVWFGYRRLEVWYAAAEEFLARPS